MIGASKPCINAIASIFLLMIGLCGKPNDTLLTPNTVLTSSFSLTKRTALSVSLTSDCCAEAVTTKQSIKISSLGMPILTASSTIRLAISNLSSAVSGMPLSSKASPKMAAPYFLAIGKIFSRLSFLPFTELISGFPL